MPAHARLTPIPVSPETTATVPAIELKSVSKTFGGKTDLVGRTLIGLGLARPKPVVRALDEVSLRIEKGEVVGLVGESGCGKSTLGRIAAGILQPSSGSVDWNGRDRAALSGADRRAAALRTQMVFQDPYAAINPRMPAAEIIGEAPRVHRIAPPGRAAFDAYIDEQFRRAGLDPALKNRYAHQFSGGQRQRIGIARALAVQPETLVCDEAVSALDVSIQAQILNLFMDLREELGLTYLFISHDLGVIERMSDRVVVMYLGRIVEQAPRAELFARPNHPYTRALLDEMPRLDTGRKSFSFLKGEIPSPVNPPTGCHFHPRCPHAMDRCRTERPAARTVAPGHVSACHLNDAA